MACELSPTYDILICSITHRTSRLALLLSELERQLVPGVGVRVFRDNLETSVGAKRQRLLDSSSADYVSFVDDDDMVHMEFVALVYEALRSRPDYVSFKVRYTLDGIWQMPVYHSLTHTGWFETPEGLYRDLSHLNPIRRDLALRAPWAGDYQEDARWATDLRKLGCVQTDVWIDEEMYWYRHCTSDTFLTDRVPIVDPPACPDFDFVTWVTR